MRQTLIQDAHALLQQGLDLLDTLDERAPGLYASPQELVSRSSIGAHLRHCIEYAECFLDGVDGGSVDYDRRERDERVERETGTARERLVRLRERIAALAEHPAGRVTIKADDHHGDPALAPRTTSSVERELQFLMSHTVHHFALIAVILRLAGLEPEHGFGVAPSTLRYWKESGLVHDKLGAGR